MIGWLLILVALVYGYGGECSSSMYNAPINNTGFYRQKCNDYCRGNGRIVWENIPCLKFGPKTNITVPTKCECVISPNFFCNIPRRKVCTNPARTKSECISQMRGLPSFWNCMQFYTYVGSKKEYKYQFACTSDFQLPNNPKTNLLGPLDTWSLVSCSYSPSPPDTYAPTSYSQSTTKADNFWNVYSYTGQKPWLWVGFFSLLFALVLIVFLCAKFLCVCKIKWFHWCKKRITQNPEKVYLQQDNYD